MTGLPLFFLLFLFFSPDAGSLSLVVKGFAESEDIYDRQTRLLQRDERLASAAVDESFSKRNPRSTRYVTTIVFRLLRAGCALLYLHKRSQVPAHLRTRYKCTINTSPPDHLKAWPPISCDWERTHVLSSIALSCPSAFLSMNDRMNGNSRESFRPRYY